MSVDTYIISSPDKLICPKCKCSDFRHCDNYNASDKVGYTAMFFYTCPNCKAKVTYHWSYKRNKQEEPAPEPVKKRKKKA